MALAGTTEAVLNTPPPVGEDGGACAGGRPRAGACGRLAGRGVCVCVYAGETYPRWARPIVLQWVVLSVKRCALGATSG